MSRGWSTLLSFLDPKKPKLTVKNIHVLVLAPPLPAIGPWPEESVKHP